MPRNPSWISPFSPKLASLSNYGLFVPFGCFLRWWYPTTMGFPTKNGHFVVFWGYHYFRKHPFFHRVNFFWENGKRQGAHLETLRHHSNFAPLPWRRSFAFRSFAFKARESSRPTSWFVENMNVLSSEMVNPCIIYNSYSLCICIHIYSKYQKRNIMFHPSPRNFFKKSTSKNLRSWSFHGKKSWLISRVLDLLHSWGVTKFWSNLRVEKLVLR